MLRTCFFIVILLTLLILKLSSVNAAVTKDWCFDTKFGHMPGGHPLPGIKNSFDPCPGKLLKKLPFEKVESHFSIGEGKQHVCNLIEGSSPLNERLKVWFELADHLKLVCVDKAKEQAIPDGFTLFSAASNEQISRPLEEAKHGMFSYFLMKGMEGDADSNNDNKITAVELHAYVEQNVIQQSSGSQTPELQGDKYRVLV